MNLKAKRIKFRGKDFYRTGSISLLCVNEGALKDPSQPYGIARLVRHFQCHLNSENFHCGLSSKRILAIEGY